MFKFKYAFSLKTIIVFQGSFILRKPRPVDQLYKLLLDNKGPEAEAVKAFFMIHKVPIKNIIGSYIFFIF